LYTFCVIEGALYLSKKLRALYAFNDILITSKKKSWKSNKFTFVKSFPLFCSRFCKIPASHL
jgi:hypothetical protein